MEESAEDTNNTASLPYDLLISRILQDSLVDLSGYKPIEISGTYDSRTFSSMGYVLIDKKCCRKDSVKGKVEVPKVSKVSADSASVLIKEA